jgi:hypothetical protein
MKNVFAEMLGVEMDSLEKHFGDDSIIRSIHTDKLSSILRFNTKTKRFRLEKIFIQSRSMHIDYFFNCCENFEEIIFDYFVNETINFDNDKIIAVCFNETNHKYLIIQSNGHLVIKTNDLKNDKTFIADFTIHLP